MTELKLENIYPVVAPKKRLESFLHEDLLDVALGFSVRVFAEDGAIVYESAMTEDDLETIGISYDDIKKAAFENFKSRYSPKLVHFSVMDALSTDKMAFGAVYLAFPEVLAGIADRFGDDLCIIPSSTEELILLKMSEAGSKDDVNSMLRDVNANPDCIDEDTYLFDNAYIFSRDTGRITKW